MLSAAADTAVAVEALHATNAAYVNYGIPNPAMYRLIFMGDSEFMKAAFGNQDEDSAGMRAHGVLLSLAKRLQSDGVMKHATMVELGELIWMTLHGMVSLQITCVGLRLSPPEKLVRLSTEILTSSEIHAPRSLRNMQLDM